MRRQPVSVAAAGMHPLTMSTVSFGIAAMPFSLAIGRLCLSVVPPAARRLFHEADEDRLAHDVLAPLCMLASYHGLLLVPMP